MINRVARGLLILAACLFQILPVVAQQPQDQWYGRMPNSKKFDPPKTFSDLFTIELPKDWQMVPGHTGTVFAVAEKTKREPGGAIIVEYMRLRAAFDPSIIGALAPIELDDVRARELGGSAFTQQIKTAAGGPLVLIQYNRPSVFGGSDHVVQYSIPSGTIMYRVICIAPAADIEKYRPIFAHTAASFTPIKGSGS